MNTPNHAPASAKVTKLARSMALDQINQYRKERGFPALTRLAPIWWKIHSQEFIEKARKIEDVS